MCVAIEWVDSKFLCWMNKENFVDDKKELESGIVTTNYKVQ